jgi:hypothetical protein
MCRCARLLARSGARDIGWTTSEYAPRLIHGQRDDADHRKLLAAALSRIAAEQPTEKSWGDGPDRARVCEQLGLATAEYCPGRELDLARQATALLPS